MSLFKPKEAWARSAPRVRLERFARQDDGSITILVIFMIMMMVMVGGIQIDFMRHEMERSRLQAMADRAALAAADLDQKMDGELVVKEYFAKAGMSNYLIKAHELPGLNFSTVTVDAGFDMKTQFLGRFGFDTLNVSVRSQAEERVENVEISLVLDISGSMASNDRLTEMQTAAKKFVDIVLKDDNEDLISVSLIPYSEQVNAGPLLLNRMKVNYTHNYSHCLEFDDSDFTKANWEPSKYYTQMQHFQWNYSGPNSMTDTVCPRYSYERILPFSQNKTALKTQIESLKPRAGTQIFLGMKWATMLLDPSYNPVVKSLTVVPEGSSAYTQPEVDKAFENRPGSYTDIETLKTIVLMTDGENSSTQRISSRYYANDSHYVHWSKYNLNWYLYNYVNSWDRKSFYWQKYDKWRGDQLLADMCSAAKAKHIVIWSVGFEVTDSGAEVMKKCASSPSHFFRVEGVELSEAFSAIASQINQLRLTQ